tara:strand:+ start:15266 stop:15400 length:135 start_codon:yes stop_codon:yes gene_type:complete
MEGEICIALYVLSEITLRGSLAVKERSEHVLAVVAGHGFKITSR